MSNLRAKVSDKYVKAFIAVAEILEPQVEFDNVIIQTSITESGESITDVSVHGFKEVDEVDVQVFTANCDGEGASILVTYWHPETCEKLWERSINYFVFNWDSIKAKM